VYQNESAPWLLFRAWNTDGTPKEDLVYNETGIVLYQSRNNEAKSTITLSNAASATDWAAGKFWQISGNLYRVGASTASISSYTGFITVQGSYTGGTLDGIAVEIVVVPSTHTAALVWSAATRSLTDKTGFALSATGLDLVTAWTTDITGSLSGNVGGIAGTINTLDELDTAQDTQHGTTQDRLGYVLAALAGACADAGTAAETYAITIGANTFTIDHAGLDATGNRGTATLTKS
jgi:hypothetical protein